MNEYKSKYSDKFTIITNEENRGLTYSLNRCIKLVHTEYIARMDADDICFKERFALQLDLMEQNESVCVCSGSFKKIGSSSNNVIKATEQEQLRSEILLRNPIAHPFAMFRASFFKNNAVYYDEEMNFAEDYALWLHLAHRYEECGFANVPYIVGLYRVHEQSICNTKKKIQQETVIRAREPYLQSLCGNVSRRESWIHDSFYIKAEASTSPEDFLEKREWLLRLKHNNDSKKIYSVQHFNACLTRKFYEVCLSSLWMGPWVVKQLMSFPGVETLNLDQNTVHTLKLAAARLASAHA